MTNQIDSNKLRIINRQSNFTKLVIKNIVDNKNIIGCDDQEKTKKGVVMDNMLLDSHVGLEGNKMNSNNVVKRGKILRRKSKISEKSSALSSNCLTSFIKPKVIGSEKIRGEYLKELIIKFKKNYW